MKIEEYVKTLKPNQCCICEGEIKPNNPRIIITGDPRVFPEYKMTDKKDGGGYLSICPACYRREIRDAIYVGD